METTVLIVDDHVVFRMGLTLLLAEEEGMRVVGEAGDGQAAVNLVRELAPDVVIMDINMPDMDGIEATRQILSAAPETKIIAHSIHAEKNFVEDMLGAGASGYVIKERTLEDLAGAIRAVQRGELFLSETIKDVVLSRYMEQLSERAAPGSRPAHSSLLTTKLHPPRVSRNTVVRPRLLEQLQEARERPLTLVSAPAGYGKSTLVSQWLESCGWPGAWLSLDARDNDLRLFLSYLVAALHTRFPETLRQTTALLDAAVLPPLHVLVQTLVNDLARLPGPFVLVLDDYHLIEEPAVHELLGELLRHPPQTMHLVLASRTDPGFDLLQMRAYRQMGELRARDLSFTIEETAAFLESFVGSAVEPSIAEEVARQTEGWVTGMHLITLSVTDSAGLADLSAILPGERHTMDYLAAEALSRQPRDIQAWLRKSSILDRFCAPLCEAVCAAGDEETSPLSGEGFIRFLADSSLFVIPLDHQNRWFRYHHLFQQLLQEQLENVLDAKEIADLRRRAAAWLAENSLIDDALSQAVAAEDVPFAVDLIERHRYELMNAEKWHILDRWLNLLPTGTIENSPLLLSTKAWSYQYRTQLAETWATAGLANDLLSTTSSSAHENQTVRGEIDTLHGLRLFLAGDAEAAIPIFQRALGILPPEALSIRSLAAILLSLGCQMTGDLDRGFKIIKDALPTRSLPADTYQARLLIGLCFLNSIAGDLTSLKQPAWQSLKIAQESDLPQSAIIARHFLGLFHYLRGELSEAAQHFEAVVGAPFVVMPLYFAHCSYGLALTYFAQGYAGKAHDVVASLISYMTGIGDTLQLDMAGAFQVELFLRENKIAEALIKAEETSFAGLPPMYYFYVPQLTSVKLLLAQNTAESRIEAAVQLAQWREFAQTKHNIRLQIDVLALQALLYNARDQQPAALESLAGSLALAEPGGFIYNYVDLGSRMADLLRRLKEQAAAGERERQIDRILAAFPPPTRRRQRNRPDDLTERELQILWLLASELSTKEIADQLEVRLNTVRMHSKNIYSKLDAHSRFEAVLNARELDII